MMEAMTKWSVVDAPSYNSVFNLSGFPAMAVCTGFGPNGLPVAMQLAARPFEEPTLLAAAHAYEQSTRWAERIPAMARD
jgi:aspartyl-tRNA(Asn)/glutamyl-tRNA(Gln) amidotransferase subunit A